MIIFRSSFFCCPGTTPGPGDDNYLVKMVYDTETTIAHNFGRLPIVSVLSVTLSQWSDAFTFEGYTTDAFSGEIKLVEIPDEEYLIDHISLNEINFRWQTLQSVYIILRA